MRKGMSIRMLCALALLLACAGIPAMAAEQDKGVVNINTANAKQLQYLPGIGAKKAQAIIDWRAQHPFRQVDDLAKVRGIGSKTVDKLRSHLAVEGRTTLKGSLNKGRKRGAKKR